MFEWLFGKKRDVKVEEETKKAFSAVKEDIKVVGKWIKHLNMKDKQLFMEISALKGELSSIRDEIEGLREGVDLVGEMQKDKQVFVKTGVLAKQTAVQGVGNAVQTAVQTDNFYDIFKSLTGNERLVIHAILNSEMKLSYEDLSLLLGKERATIRGQVNAIRQKAPGLLEELVEKNGKKRVFVPEEIRQKLSKYAKVRVKKKKLSELPAQNEVKYG